MAQMVEVLKALLSTDNVARNAAEKQFEGAKKTQAAQTIASLFEVLGQPALEEPVREQAAVLLRQCLAAPRAATSIWHTQLSEAARADVKGKLLELVEADASAKVRRKVADAVQALGNNLIDIDEHERPQNLAAWPELMPALMRMVMDSSKDGGVRADAMWAVKELVVSVWPMLLAGAAQTLQVLKASLTDSVEGVRANAASLLCEFIDCVQKKDERKAFTPLIADLCNALKALADGGDVAMLNTVLQSMQCEKELADFFKEHIAQGLLPVLSAIATSHGKEDTRRLALEVIVTFAESKPKAMLKVPGYVKQTVEICTRFMMELDNDVEGWAAQDDEDADEEEQSAAGKESLDRLAAAMHKAEHFSSVMDELKPVMAQLFQQPDWKATVAGVTMMAQIAEYVEEEEMVNQMLGAIKAQLRATHVRVRYAAWHAVVQFSTDHKETITKEVWIKQLVPEFLQGLDESSERVVVACLTAWPHYGENLEREDLEPFVDPLMAKLGSKLQGKTSIVKEVITFIAVIAGQIEDGFAKFYGPLMPVLKQVIGSAIHKVEERELLGKAFECISLLASAVGKDAFKGDAQEIMTAMVSATKVPGLPKDDPVKEYMMAASERICMTLKEDFAPYVEHLLPDILEKLKLAPKEYGEGTEVDENSSLIIVPTDNGQQKILVMNSSELEDVQHAIECVHTFVDKMGQKYFPFISPTAQALLPVFDFDMDEDIREKAFETWGLLIKVAKDGNQGQVLKDLVKEFLSRILAKLASGSADLSAVSTRLVGTRLCLSEAGPGVLGSEEVRGIVQLALQQIADSFARRDSAEAKQGGKPSVDEDGDEDEAEEDQEDLVRHSAANVTSAVMTHHPDLFVGEGLQPFLAVVQGLLTPGKTKEDRQLGLFMCSVLAEALGARSVPHWEGFVPAVLQDVQHEEPSLREAACYALSFLARENAYAPQAATTGAKLAQVVATTRSLPKKKANKPHQSAADSALSALGELLVHHEATLGAGAAALWGAWASGLPCQEDEAEGIRNHKLLAELVLKQKPEIIGASGENLPKLLAILIDIYKTDMADDDLSEAIGKLLVGAGESQLEQYAANFAEKQKKKLVRIVRESQGKPM